MSVPLVTVYDDTFTLHDWPGHPESAARLRAITGRIAGDTRLRDLPLHAATDATPEQILAVHHDRHLHDVERAAVSGGGWIDADTYCTSHSYDVALRAAGAAAGGVGTVCRGEARTVFALVRPPGHHATPDRPMGFCLFNNAAVGARVAQREHGLERVAIVDIDVHHGNGTQDIFYEDPSVLYCSLHQWPLYPGTGRASETGAGAGAGTTRNVPLPPGTDGAAWLAAFEEHVVPALRAHAPELIVVSAGYDAHRDDPLAALHLDTSTYAEVARRLRDLAAETCEGRMLWLLEGGYDLEALSDSVAETMDVLGR